MIVLFGDQGILNRLFENRWYALGSSYNFMVGMDTVAKIIKLIAGISIR